MKHGDVEKIDCQFCKAHFLYQYKYERHLQNKHKLTASDIDMIRKGNQQKMDLNQQRKEDLITIQKSQTFDLRVTESKKKRGGQGMVKSYSEIFGMEGSFRQLDFDFNHMINDVT